MNAERHYYQYKMPLLLYQIKGQSSLDTMNGLGHASPKQRTIDLMSTFDS